MIHTTIEWPMSEERFLELYGQHFPGEPCDTENAMRVLRFAAEVARHSWQNGARVVQGVYEQRQLSGPKAAGSSEWTP